VADYQTRRRTVQHTEYVVPARAPYGVHLSELMKALSAAERAAHDQGITDIWVRVGDEEVIFAFETHRVESGS
jgi:hypothetical protein